MAGWIVSGRALRPVERIRREASAISATELDHRLTAPPTNDEIRRLAETLNEMLARLEAATERERRFLDDASHELRTPLTALKSELDLTRSRPRSPDELAAALVSASEETDRLVRMSEDLLVLSRAHGGRLPVHPDRTSLRDLVTSASKLFHALAESSGVSIDVTAPDVTVFVDRSRVRQAIDNLLDNAVRHSPRGGAVRVHAGTDNGSVRIVVEDEGPGFPAGFEQRAFEPFQRAAKRTEGAGLGLAIVKAIAESHGGSVSADNKPDGGARVVLTLRHLVDIETPAKIDAPKRPRSVRPD
jgi:heavy metal sensor kinase